MVCKATKTRIKPRRVLLSVLEINQIIEKYKLKFVFLDNLIYSPPYQWSPGTSICLCVLK